MMTFIDGYGTLRINLRDDWPGQSFGVTHPDQRGWSGKDDGGMDPWEELAYYHYYVVERIADGGYIGHCACGWRTASKSDHKGVERATLMHRSREHAERGHAAGITNERPTDEHGRRTHTHLTWMPRF
jgi:hypothetical protein